MVQLAFRKIVKNTVFSEDLPKRNVVFLKPFNSNHHIVNDILFGVFHFRFLLSLPPAPWYNDQRREVIKLFGVLANIAGFLGFVLSVYIMVSQWFQNRENFKISVLDYNDAMTSVRFLIAVENHSRTALVITSISAFGTDCELEPKMIRGKPEAWNGATSVRLPVRVQARDAEIFYIEFLTHRHIPLSPEMSVTFEIHSIDRTVQKTVLLGNKSHYLH